MITDKIKALFQFIEFLHSNIENFMQYNNLINEVYLLDTERKKLKHRNNFKEKLKYDEIQGRIKDKYKIVEENILELIESKLMELIKRNWKDPGAISLLFEHEILILKEKVTTKDIPIIKQEIKKYIDFKERTKWPHFIDYLFDELDDKLKELYNYFIADEPSEFKVNSFNELINLNQLVNKSTLGHLASSDATQVMDFINNTIQNKKELETLLPQTDNLTESKEYEQSIRVTKKATKEDVERFDQWPGNTIKVGDEYSTISEPKNKDELFERFKKLNAQRYFESLERIFVKKYNEGNEKIIKDELRVLNQFIDKANQLSTTETFDNKYPNSELHEYSRLANDYYKNPILPFYPVTYFNNKAVEVYAKYFLYKDWLDQKLNSTQPAERQHLINKGFIERLRLNLANTSWGFDKLENTEIVNKELSHGFLLSNFNIDNSIIKYYCLPSSSLLSDGEFQKMVKTGFVGEKETALYPYSNIIYGAYYSRSDLVGKLTGIAFGSRPKKNEGTEIKYFTDLIPYFKVYAKGFQNGFNEFDNKQIKPYLIEPIDKQDRINKVFEYITKNLFFKHGWATLQSGFGTNQNNEIINAFEDGQIQGYYYRAWSIVFSSNKLFAPLFQEHLKAEEQQKESKNETIDSLINNLSHQMKMISPEHFYHFVKDITNTVTFLPSFSINEKQFNILSKEVSVFLKTMESKIDINNPDKAVNYYKKKFEPLFKDAKILEAISLAKYREVLENIEQSKNDINSYPERGHFIKMLENEDKIQKDIQVLGIEKIILCTDTLKQGLVNNIKRLADKLNEFSSEPTQLGNEPNFKPAQYPDALALNYMTEENYTIYCMVPEVRNNINVKEKAFFASHQHLLSKDLRDFVNKWISCLLNNKPIQETDDTIKIKSYHELMLAEYGILPPQQTTKQKPELKIDEIALKYAYEGLQITRGNGNDIAKQYGHNSGEKLFQRFTYYSSAANRKGKPTLCTPKKLDNKIKLIERVIELLPTDKKERAKDEVSILKKINEAEYQ